MNFVSFFVLFVCGFQKFLTLHQTGFCAKKSVRTHHQNLAERFSSRCSIAMKSPKNKHSPIFKQRNEDMMGSCNFGQFIIVLKNPVLQEWENQVNGLPLLGQVPMNSRVTIPQRSTSDIKIVVFWVVSVSIDKKIISSAIWRSWSRCFVVWILAPALPAMSHRRTAKGIRKISSGRSIQRVETSDHRWWLSHPSARILVKMKHVLKPTDWICLSWRKYGKSVRKSLTTNMTFEVQKNITPDSPCKQFLCVHMRSAHIVTADHLSSTNYCASLNLSWCWMNPKYVHVVKGVKLLLKLRFGKKGCNVSMRPTMLWWSRLSCKAS